ncbi:hypothetical protein CDEST_02950 [Colletotrichum destructivum]|uniref:Uncharacterized protein n=1 Tax=Colletotrichum destructivum TaxID=34406 RepID=A0AAX4I4M7_9PEZI|nr:hypothetical protein CDEST_02950 [Colletotrichum destructivum]
MRFTSIIVTGALAILASAQATSTSTAVSAASSEQAVITECLKGCPATDVNCQSKCISVPNPNESQVNQTTACVAACDQGDGSPEDTQKYSDCSQNCIKQYFFSAGGTPAATAGSGSGSAASGGASAATASASGSGAAASAFGTATRASGSAATGTDAAATGATTPNAAPALIGSASFGVVGIIGALLL